MGVQANSSESHWEAVLYLMLRSSFDKEGVARFREASSGMLGERSINVSENRSKRLPIINVRI